MDNLTGLGIWLIALNPTLRGDMRWELSQGVPLRIVIRARDVSSGWPFPKEIFLEINEFFEFGCLHQGPVEGDLELSSGKSNIFLMFKHLGDVVNKSCTIFGMSRQKGTIHSQQKSLHVGVLHQFFFSHLQQDGLMLILSAKPRSANQDLSTSDAIKISGEVELKGERTFGGLTTIDLMDKVTDTVDVSWYLLIVVLTGVPDSVLNLDDLAYTCRQYAYECMHIEDIGGSREEEKSSSRLE
ncbi:hypothetical protein ACH5RR_014617 [Cinchona calisaya]|uniref:Uncharacterized protein n=1 Tax=Cinchona calisaya TaxID=153742 RepID=A0ABD2ZRZ9_9GENT